MRIRPSPNLLAAGVVPIVLAKNTGVLTISRRTPGLWATLHLAGITNISHSFGVHISTAVVHYWAGHQQPPHLSTSCACTEVLPWWLVPRGYQTLWAGGLFEGWAAHREFTAWKKKAYWTYPGFFLFFHSKSLLSAVPLCSSLLKPSETWWRMQRAHMLACPICMSTSPCSFPKGHQAVMTKSPPQFSAKPNPRTLHDQVVNGAFMRPRGMVCKP